jgi:flagellar hook-basal body complex protein FliE
MLPIGATSPLLSQAIRSPLDIAPSRETFSPKGPAGIAPSGGGFGDIFEKLVTDVETKQSESAAVTRSVLLGDNPNLHQSVIAMQEASVSFGLMVEVRNKVVEAYQELIRMPV